MTVKGVLQLSGTKAGTHIEQFVGTLFLLYLVPQIYCRMLRRSAALEPLKTRRLGSVTKRMDDQPGLAHVVLPASYLPKTQQPDSSRPDSARLASVPASLRYGTSCDAWAPPRTIMRRVECSPRSAASDHNISEELQRTTRLRSTSPNYWPTVTWVR